MKKGIMGESLVFVISAIAVIALIAVFFIVLKISGKVENVIKEEKLNEQSLMALDLLKTKLPASEELGKDEIEGKTALSVLNENDVLWKDKDYAGFLIELHELNINNNLKISVFRSVTYSLMKDMIGVGVWAEFPGFVASKDIRVKELGLLGQTKIKNMATVNIPLRDGRIVNISMYRREK